MFDEREKLFFEASFVVFHDDFIAHYIPFGKQTFLCKLLGFLLCLCSRICLCISNSTENA